MNKNRRLFNVDVPGISILQTLDKLFKDSEPDNIMSILPPINDKFRDEQMKFLQLLVTISKWYTVQVNGVTKEMNIITIPDNEKLDMNMLSIYKENYKLIGNKYIVQHDKLIKGIKEVNIITDGDTSKHDIWISFYIGDIRYIYDIEKGKLYRGGGIDTYVAVIDSKAVLYWTDSVDDTVYTTFKLVDREKGKRLGVSVVKGNFTNVNSISIIDNVINLKVKDKSYIIYKDNIRLV